MTWLRKYMNALTTTLRLDLNLFCKDIGFFFKQNFFFLMIKFIFVICYNTQNQTIGQI